MKTHSVEFKVTIYEKNSKGIDQIIECRNFNSRGEVNEFLKFHNNPPIQYRTNDKISHTLEA